MLVQTLLYIRLVMEQVQFWLFAEYFVAQKQVLLIIVFVVALTQV